MNDNTTFYDHGDDLTALFVGRRIIKAEMPVDADNTSGRYGSFASGATKPVGLLTLDDGTRVYVAGNDGGCACSAGCYELTKLATVDNIITDVKVIDESKGNYDDYDEENPGRWVIFVYTAHESLAVAEFEGDDGNGYYGTGFHLAVIGVAA